VTSFSQLQISKWQQFGDISILFDRPATILTGANGSGKTTLLGFLARHANWNLPSLATPWREGIEELLTQTETTSDDPLAAAERAGAEQNAAQQRSTIGYRFVSRLFRNAEVSDTQIGTLTYENGSSARLMVPTASSASYTIAIDGQQQVECFFVPSHRGIYRYVQVGQIPISPIDRQNAYARVVGSLTSRYFGQQGHPASYFMKEALVAWSIFGRGNVDMDPDPEALKLFLGFQDVLRKVLPPTLGFRRLSIRKYEVTLDCSSGDFLLDGASGGISTIIDLAWMIYMFSSSKEATFTVLIDEVENHLHPTMQRRLLSDFIEAFPNARFVVSTHSPLIVTSLRDAAIYVLKYRASDDVVSERLDFQNQARTATQILDEVLGVSSTMPIWAEADIDLVVRRFRDSAMDEGAFGVLKTEMQRLGLGAYLPLALGKALEAKQP